MSVLARSRPRVRHVPGAAHLPAHWRAACVILAAAFPRDEEVWARVSPGVRADLHRLITDPRRAQADRTLLACAQSLIDATAAVPFAALANLDDRRLTLALDALGIARGSFPTID